MAIVGRTDYLELRATVKKDVAEVLAIGGREKDASAALREALELCEREGNLAGAAALRKYVAPGST